MGGKQPNAWGLHDMHGNVWEWCWDWYGGNYYEQFVEKRAKNPTGSDSAGGRVLRGGSWRYDEVLCRTSNRYWNYPGSWDDFLGFRLARD